MIFLLIFVVIAVIAGAVAQSESWFVGLLLAILVPAGIWGVLSLLNHLLHIP